MTKKKTNKQEETGPAGEEITEAAPQEAQSAPQEAPKSPDYYDQLLRLQADFENYRKRTEREKPLFIRFGKAEVIKKLLPLYDALQKARAEVEKNDAGAGHIEQGLKMIFEEFEKFFKTEGVEVVNAQGKPYDPMTQEVVTTMPCEDDLQDGIVQQELCPAVMHDGKIIRPAQVIVGKKKQEAN
ncbi:MAG: nucleotide exchange factor GrpE [Elusimicrobiota bacterium]|jgi:molecular chaperone GrpE|nr:nucleotide exchange factor GrpE [Elusimicrobiota bacterium]